MIKLKDLLLKETNDPESKKSAPYGSGYAPVKEDNPRIPRKKGQKANSDKHSDLYTDENPKGTIKGLKFASVEDAKKSVRKIKASGKKHAHKIQAAIAMEQRAKAAGKISQAKVYRSYIDSIKKSETKLKEILINMVESRCERLPNESEEDFLTRCGNQGWGPFGGVNMSPAMSLTMQKKIVVPIKQKDKKYKI